MKKVVLLSALLILFVSLSSSLSAQSDCCGIIIGDAVIVPGDKVVNVFGAMGLPEHIWALRGKAGQKDDYVKLDYVDYGLSFSVTNGNEDGSKGNLIKSIYVLKRGQKLKGIPFGIGDPYEKAKQAWGEPEKKEGGNANYFKRGVMLQVDDRGIIDIMQIQKPGKVDFDDMPKHKV